MTRPFKDVPSVELEARLRSVFKEHRDVIQELVVRGWDVSLVLPTDGYSNNWGYQPTRLSERAGFYVSRKVSPSSIKNDAEYLK